MAEQSWKMRAVVLVFVFVSIFALSFAQLGFLSIGIVDGKPVYLLPLLAPLVMGCLLFGAVMGAIFGLFAGAVVFAHATLLPLDYYEVFFMTPLNTFLLLTFIGFLSGLLFSLRPSHYTSKLARFAQIAATCILISLIASLFVAFNTFIVYADIEDFLTISDYLFNSPLGIAIQALIDAAILIVVCIFAEYVIRNSTTPEGDRKLRSVFRNWMLTISFLVFSFTSAVIFSLATVQCQNAAEESMLSEIRYLEKQILQHDISEYGSLLDGYEFELDGTVVITDKHGTILATDNPEHFPVGDTIERIFGASDIYTADELVEEYFEWLLDEDESVAAFQSNDESGMGAMDISFFSVVKFDDGYIAIVWPPEKIYASRFGIMVSSTILAMLLIAAIGMVATILLNRVVVNRIDETNDSLAKITNGNLDERVRVRNSLEFSSLSTGINTTVGALKDSIAEAEQKNAQELTTAKAIQESALPRDFPPFPDIDRFDVYASMKTAKEVGGDFYNFFLIGDDRLGFMIADVSGKGIPAALFMMTAKTQIQNYIESDLPIDEAVTAANHQLCIGNDASMFVTMFACILNYQTGELNYVNAGHNPPLIFHDGSWEWIRDISGVPLGLYDGVSYRKYTRNLVRDDLLYLYTDGVTEAMDAEENLFGNDRLEKTLEIYEDMNPRSVGVGVRRAITDFTLDTEQSDDITMLILKYGVPPEKKAVMILRADDKQLVHVHNFIHEELHRRSAPKWVQNPLDIAAEELFVNVCHYAYPDATPEDPGEVRISFVYESNPPSLTVSISDDGVPYNPLDKPDAVTPSDIEDVPIGGLGILMAKRSVDEMTYRREDGSNIVTFRKGW